MWKNVYSIVRCAGIIIPIALLFHGIECSSLATADGAGIDASKAALSSLEPARNNKESDFRHKAAVAEDYGKLPLSFEVNNGQVDKTANSLKLAESTWFSTSTRWAFG
jgi:hypothetical protein